MLQCKKEPQNGQKSINRKNFTKMTYTRIIIKHTIAKKMKFKFTRKSKRPDNKSQVYRNKTGKRQSKN